MHEKQIANTSADTRHHTHDLVGILDEAARQDGAVQDVDALDELFEQIDLGDSVMVNHRS